MSLAESLLTQTWWRYNATDPLHRLYHFFNLAEGLFWIALGGIVIGRFLRYHRSPLEVAYALAFLTFGLTDFREAWRLESWLLLIKGLNLGLLLWLRWIVIRRFYPHSRAF